MVARAVLLFLTMLAIAAAAAERPHPGRDLATVPPAQLITSASLLVGKMRMPPADSAAWQPVALPDDWNRTRPGFFGIVWYRITFELPEVPPYTYQLYMPRTSATNVTFWVNGHRLGTSAPFGDPRLTELHRPMSYAMPPVVLRQGQNVIHFRVAGEADYRHGLTSVTIGHGYRVRRDHYQPRYDLQITSAAIFGALLLGAGVLALFLWRANRRDSVMLWFGLTALASALASAQQVWPIQIEQPALRDLILFIAKYLYATPLLVLSLRIGKVRAPRTEAALWAVFVTGCVAATAVPVGSYPGLVTWASAVYIVMLAVLFGWLCTRVVHGKQWHPWLLALSIAALISAHGYDLARWLGFLDYETLVLAPYATSLLIVALAATAIDRHVSAMRGLEEAKRNLERDVAAKVREIEDSYHAVQALQREQAVVRERQRIMGDMHDGLGSSLVSMLSLVQAGNAPAAELERRLNSSIVELRAIVDSLEPVDGDLAAVLGNVRYRMRAAIEDSGARFVWDVDELPQVEALTPAVILAIERILLEALSNALQHAAASTVTVTGKLSGDSRAVVIRVADDGTGFDPAASANGRGLRGLVERARRTGLSVTIDSDSTGRGTRVTLTVPLRAGAAAPQQARAAEMAGVQ